MIIKYRLIDLASEKNIMEYSCIKYLCNAKVAKFTMKERKCIMYFKEKVRKKLASA